MRSPTLAVLAGAVLALAGCGGSDNSNDTGDSGEGKEISFQVAGAPDEFKLYRQVAEAYEKASGVKVNLIEVADEESFGTKLASSIAAKRAPDVALISYRGYKKYAAKDQFVPLGPKVGDDKLAEYYEEPLKAFTYEGEVQCLPQNLSSLVVYYNADLFRAAGIDPPKPDWTYDDLIAAADAVHGITTRDGEVYGVSIEKELIRLAPFIWSAGGEVADDEDNPTKLTLDTPEARRGLEHYLALAKYGPDAEVAEAEGEDPLFLEGRLGMVLASRRKTPTYRQASFKWDVAPFPKDVQQTTVLHTDGFCVLSGSKHEAEAIKFAEFAGGVEGQRILTQLGRVVPSIKSLAESDEFANATPPENNQVFVDAEKIMRILPTVPDSPAIEQRVERALEAAYFGRISIDEFLERVESETGPIFRGDVDEEELQRETEEEAEREASGEGESEEEREAEEAEGEAEEAEASETP
jgi:multiple sugar transport system substrate-binding protein